MGNYVDSAKDIEINHTRKAASPRRGYRTALEDCSISANSLFLVTLATVLNKAKNLN